MQNMALNLQPINFRNSTCCPIVYLVYPVPFSTYDITSIMRMRKLLNKFYSRLSGRDGRREGGRGLEGLTAEGSVGDGSKKITHFRGGVGIRGANASGQ